MKKRKNALTLIEVLIAVVLFSIAGAATIQSFYAGNVFFRTNTGKIIIQQNARHIMQSVERDIRHMVTGIDDVVLVSAGDIVTLDGTDGIIQYTLEEGGAGDTFLLKRNGTCVGTNVSSLRLASTGLTISITLDVAQPVAVGQNVDFQLVETVRSRNG